MVLFFKMLIHQDVKTPLILDTMMEEGHQETPQKNGSN